MKELPVDTPDNPWCIEEAELNKRRDLRSSHLIFSIDPKGCEDVDDTLSVRLANFKLCVIYVFLNWYNGKMERKNMTYIILCELSLNFIHEKS